MDLKDFADILSYEEQCELLSHLIAEVFVDEMVAAINHNLPIDERIKLCNNIDLTSASGERHET